MVSRAPSTTETQLHPFHKHNNKNNKLLTTMEDSSANAFFDNFPQEEEEHNVYGFTSQEGHILNKMVSNVSASMNNNNNNNNNNSSRGGIVVKPFGKPRSDSSDSSDIMNDSMGTSATMGMSPEEYSNATGATSISVVSISGSVVPIKRRLTQHEEAAFGQWGDGFPGDDSFGSLEEDNFPSWSRPSQQANRPLSKKVSLSNSSRASSRRSLYSVDEDEEHEEDNQEPAVSLPHPMEQTQIHLHSTQQQQQQDLIADDEASIDPASLGASVASTLGASLTSITSKKLSPVHEGTGKKNKKKSKKNGARSKSPKKDRSKDRSKSPKRDKKKKNKTRKPSKKEVKDFASASADSADDILARWNAKIVDLERSISELETNDDAPVGSRRESNGDLGLSRNWMDDYGSSPASAVDVSPTSPLDTPVPTKGKLARSSIRPTLYTVFEWNNNPSPTTPTDPAAGTSKKIVNSSTIRERRRRLRRSYSTTDVNQYNNTPMWPPTKRHATRGLHSQFFRRDTNLPTQSSVMRAPSSSPVVSPKQMLEIMEPVTMREVLEFKGFADNTSFTTRNSLNYDEVLDCNSLESSQASSIIPRILRDQQQS